MKNNATTLAVLALLGVSLVLAGCPRHARPHVPHPHRLPHPLVPMDSMLQLERQNNAVMLSTRVMQATVTRIV
jgi:hypothetical protein